MIAINESHAASLALASHLLAEASALPRCRACHLPVIGGRSVPGFGAAVFCAQCASLPARSLAGEVSR